jgi:hypothetical protein
MQYITGAASSIASHTFISFRSIFFDSSRVYCRRTWMPPPVPAPKTLTLTSPMKAANDTHMLPIIDAPAADCVPSLIAMQLVSA